jgi:radical SAM superfamily enzyme YgiQ (UPF0313 family)
MNVLLVYPKLPLSFWSAPEAIRFNAAKALFAPLGPITLAALLPTDWNIKFIDYNVSELTEADWHWLDALMISGMIVQKEGFHTLIKEAKKRSKLTIAGGPYPTLMPEELIEAGCDYVICGEAENAIQSLLTALHSGKSGQIITSTEKPDLSCTPVPRYDLINLNNYLFFLVQTTRGCPFSCEFCDIAGLYGKVPRVKDPSQVMAEIEHLYQLGARGTILFADDNFIANKKNAKAICRELIVWNKKRRQPFGFMTQASVNLGQDLEMIDLMTAANFGEIFIGIESPDEDILTAHQKHHNVSNPLFESIENIRNNGLSIIGSFIIGFDNEEQGAGQRICDFVDQTHIPTVMLNILTAPPGTKLSKRLQEEGRLFDRVTKPHSGETTFSLPNFTPSRPLEEIIEEYIAMWEYLYHPARFLERTYKFCLAVRPTRKATATDNDTQPSEKLAETAGAPFRQSFYAYLAFLHHVWGHGIVAPHRVQFWKQLYGMWKKNPSRLKKYLIHCISGESCMLISKTIRYDVNRLLEGQHKER